MSEQKQNNEEEAPYESFSDEIEESPKDTEDSEDESATPDPLAEKERIIQMLEEQAQRLKDQMVRALAEAENTRKRALKERQDISKFAVSNFARDILSVADNLRRALDCVSEEEAAALSPQFQNLTQGVEATERELLRVFEKNGIVKTEPLDETFDPNFHEVMFEAPVPGKESGAIIQIIEPGYLLNGRLLRPARVGIAKNADAPSSQAGHIDTEA